MSFTINVIKTTSKPATRMMPIVHKNVLRLMVTQPSFVDFVGMKDAEIKQERERERESLSLMYYSSTCTIQLKPTYMRAIQATLS